MRIRQNLRFRKSNSLRKKGQEEIVGFVAVVVLVVVILLIVLAIVIRRQANEPLRDSREVSEFLDASFKYTSKCEKYSQFAYAELGELLELCLNSQKCLDGSNPCDIAEESLEKMIEASWPIGEDRPIKGYVLNATYVKEGSKELQEVLFFEKGSCSNVYRGAEQYLSEDNGKIYASLKLCS